MRYLRIDTPPVLSSAPWWIEAVESVAHRLGIGPAPELADRYRRVAYYWLEIADSGQPQREIGFDSEDEGIVAAPLGNEWGFLIDASDDWSDSTEDSPEAEARFEEEWVNAIGRIQAQ